MEIRRFLVRLQPDRVTARHELAMAIINLGVSYGRCDQPARADAEYQKALALLEALVRDNRAVPESLLLLGKTCYNRAFQLRSTARPKRPWRGTRRRRVIWMTCSASSRRTTRRGPSSSRCTGIGRRPT